MNILLTSAGRRSYLVEYFKESLNGKGLVHVSNSVKSQVFYYADKSVITPLIYDDNYIPFLLNYCKENNINAIISLFDIDLPILSKNIKKFEEIGVKVIVSDFSIIDICNDKFKTYSYLFKNGFNVPKTYLKIDKVITDINENKISYPIIIKPRWGMASIGVFEAENEEELKVLYKKTLREIKKSYLKYISSENLNESVIIQEKLKGQEYGLDIINDLESNYQNTVAKIKYAMRSGETDSSETVDIKELKTIGENLSKITKHIANLDVDVFSHNNKYYILEMNARFGGGYPFSHIAGVNLPLAIVEWLQGKSVDKSLLTEKIGIFGFKNIEVINIEK